ncbi:MAG: methionine synthase [Ruminococcaceae bacterium]|nr:methionine synthase [Oscillospiraceae bacterium]
MEKLTIDKIDKNEALRYLGQKDDGTLSKNIDEALSKAIRQTLSVVNPRAVHALFSIDELKNADLLEGKDIKKHLKGCTHAILLALTLGTEIEQKIRASQAIDALFPVMLDACATAAAESSCDKYSQSLNSLYSKKGLFLTSRFSPGYGDFPIEKQHILLRLVDAERKIGLYVTESSILTPRKSITAIIGASDVPVHGKMAGCKNCALKDKCDYKNKGETCNV